MKIEGRLLGSAPSLEGIKQVCEKFFCGATIGLKYNGTGFDVHNSHGIIKGCVVVKSGKRFKLVML